MDASASTTRNYLTRVGKASGHLLRLIEQVLTISQVHAGRSRAQLEEVDLSTIVREVAELVQPLTAGRKLAVEVELPAAPVLFATDAAKFRQIVLNLSGKRPEVTLKGEVRLILAEEGGAILFSVRDTGVGVSAEEVERLFESFWQTSWGGDVSVDSTPGQGSTFTVTLPRLRAEDSRATTGEVDVPATRNARMRA